MGRWDQPITKLFINNGATPTLSPSLFRCVSYR
eukprot:COSAG03_NODE_1679_length_3654_cov_3.468917_1_plen_33_part_00